MPDDGAIADDRLRLIFTCCHPALALEARVALTVKSLGGLTTAEVARAFLVSEPTMAQRLVRAKRKIAAARHPLPRPAGRAAARAPATASWPSSTWSSTRATRRPTATAWSAASCAARRSASAGCWSTCMPDDPEALGLLALMLLQDARRDARVDERGDVRRAGPPGPHALGPRPHRRGHRTRCDRALRAERRRAPTNCRPRSPRCTRPRRRRGDRLGADRRALRRARPSLAPSPVVRVNRAVALAFAGAPEAGLALARPLLDDARLGGYAPLHAAHAELLRRTGATDAARGRVRPRDRGHRQRRSARRAAAPSRRGLIARFPHRKRAENAVPQRQTQKVDLRSGFATFGPMEPTTVGRKGSLKNPEVYENVPGQIIPAIVTGVRRLRQRGREVPRRRHARERVHRLPAEAGRLRPAPARRPDDPDQAAVRRRHAGPDGRLRRRDRDATRRSTRATSPRDRTSRSTTFRCATPRR